MWMVAEGGTGHTRAFGAASPEPIEFGCEPGDVSGRVTLDSFVHALGEAVEGCLKGSISSG